MKFIARAVALFNVLPCVVALEGTAVSSIAAGKRSAAKTSAEDISAEIRAEMRKEIQHELALHDVKREVLVQSSIHNARGESSTMQKLKMLKALEQKEHKNAQLLAKANKRLHAHTKRLRAAFLEERASLKADSKQLQHWKHMQKVSAGTVQKMKTEMHALQLELSSLRSSLAQEKLLSGKFREESEQEVHREKGQISELQQHEHKIEQQNKEKDKAFASLKASMLQEENKIETQSQRELNVAKQKLRNLEEGRQKDQEKYASNNREENANLYKLRNALAESRGKAAKAEQQLKVEAQTNQRLLNAQTLLSKDFAQFRSKTAAEQAAKEKMLQGLKRSINEQLRKFAALQETAGRTTSQLVNAERAETADNQEISTLNKNAMAQKVQLMGALKEISALQDKLEVQAQSQADLARQSLTAQNEAKQEMASKDMQYASLKQKFSETETDAQLAANKVKEQSKQLQLLQKQLAEAQASGKAQVKALQDQLHNVMLSASQKVRAMEDQEEGMQTSLQQDKAALLQANTQATDEANEVQSANAAELKASRELMNTQNALRASQSAAAAAAAKARMEEETIADLRSQVADKDGLEQKLKTSAEMVESWQEKAETFQRKYASEANSLQIAKQQSQKLSDQVEVLGDADRRASLLQNQLQSDQKAETSKDKQIADLKQHGVMLEQLNDHFSQQVDFYNNESKTWHTKADVLEENLQQRTSQLQIALRKSSEAAKSEKDARSQEDVYFEEAQKLQQKYDAQSSALEAAYEMSNSSSAETTRLKDNVERLEGEQARDQRNSHAVWVDVERELVQAQKKQAWAQAEISQTRLEAMKAESLLTDEQRAKLGLPPREKESAKVAPRKPTQLMYRH